MVCVHCTFATTSNDSSVVKDTLHCIVQCTLYKTRTEVQYVIRNLWYLITVKSFTSN